MSRRNQKNKPAKNEKWNVVPDTAPFETDDPMIFSDNPEDRSLEHDSTAINLKKWKKDLKAGRLSKLEFDELRENDKVTKMPTEEQKMCNLTQESNRNAAMYNQSTNIDENAKNLKVDGITISYKGTILLEETDLIINHGRKYGLIGPNGSGKSTLLKHISLRHIHIPSHIKILHVEQEVEGTEESVLGAVLSADRERTTLLAEEKTLKIIYKQQTDIGSEASERLVEIWTRLRVIGSHTAESRAAVILSGLQFTLEMQKKPTKEFSGGWRMRVALACALFVQPALLILDEPTNHLDLDASIWLETYLQKYNKTLLLVSHDREFLNETVTDIIDLRNKKLNYYKGNYDAFERVLSEEKRIREKERKKNKLKCVKKSEHSLHFRFQHQEKLKIPVLQIKNVGFHYPLVGETRHKTNIFTNIELNLDCDSKIAIVGPNGVGKSTFIDLVVGNLKPTAGEIYRSNHLRMAKFSQHAVDQLNMTETPMEYIGKKYPKFTPQEVRNKLGMFGLYGKTHMQAISLLSGGQKSRVCLCEISLSQPHILFLDEPTNHLDIQSVDALAESLIQWKGGVVFVTHDQRLVSRVAKDLWICNGDNSIIKYEGSFDDYKKEIVNKIPDTWFSH